MSAVVINVIGQNVGIGTTTPNSNAALEIKSTDKGILFPRLTSAQRNAISNPPDGLHIYNKEERCLNYYDSLYQTWNCYCHTDTCKTITFNINDDIANINFYSTYAINYPGIRKFVLLISQDVTVNGSFNYNNNMIIPAIDFSTMPYNTYPINIKIINYGNIYGVGGNGGDGAAGPASGTCNNVPAKNGASGGPAITTHDGIIITVLNYSIISAGGGGGGGGGRTTASQFGGGGGGGVGIFGGTGGLGGGNTVLACPAGVCGCVISSSIALSGANGTNVTPGNGGAGAGGGGNGGNGGGAAQAGQNGLGSGAGLGGQPGKAISGGVGNSILNFGGISFGIVD